MKFDINWDEIKIDEMELADLKKLAEDLQSPPKSGWTHTTGVSPLKLQLKVVSRMLELTKKEYEKEHANQLRRLDTLMRSQVRNDPNSTVRVKKNGNKR